MKPFHLIQFYDSTSFIVNAIKGEKYDLKNIDFNKFKTLPHFSALLHIPQVKGRACFMGGLKTSGKNIFNNGKSMITFTIEQKKNTFQHWI